MVYGFNKKDENKTKEMLKKYVGEDLSADVIIVNLGGLSTEIDD